MKTLLLTAASAAVAATGPGSPSPTPPGTSPVPVPTSLSGNFTPGSFVTITLVGGHYVFSFGPN